MVNTRHIGKTSAADSSGSHGGNVTGKTTQSGVAATGPSPGKRTLVSSVPVAEAGPTDKERALVRGMIDNGQRDENGLTNAVFHARHADLAGIPLAKGTTLAGEWLAIRDDLVRPALTAPAAIAKRPSTTSGRPAASDGSTGPAASTPGLGPQGIDSAGGVFQAAYHRMITWLSEALEPAPTPDATSPPSGDASPASVGAPPQSSGFTAGEARFHTKTPTVEGGTLDIANTRASKGDAGTAYSLGGTGLATSLMSGDKDAATFYCSGLSIWTLAAAGYDVSKPLVGADGVPFTYTMVDKSKNKAGADVKQRFEIRITLKQIIDGEPPAVEAMAIAEQSGMKNGGSVGELTGQGHAAGHGKDGESHAVKGAAGALVLADLGTEVDELDQKPGDFAQSRRTTAGVGDDTEVRHRGAGHAWQVWSVKVVGNAIFGQDGSPKPSGGALTGWHEGVEFVIDKDTRPALVGEHNPPSQAARIEANVAGAGTLTKSKQGGDGGVQVTGEHLVPDPGSKSYTDYVVYYGRLGTSPWSTWTKATKPIQG
jgi:hypothetical protein